MIQYQDTGIKLPYAQFFKDPQEINPINAQHRITQDEYNQFCLRLRFALKGNRKIEIFGLAIMILLIGVMVIIDFASNETSISFILCIPVFIGAVILIVNKVAMNRNLERFLNLENSQVWNSRGLNWSVGGYGKLKYLNLQITSEIPRQNYYHNPIMQPSENNVQIYMNQAPKGYHPDQPAHELCNHYCFI